MASREPPREPSRPGDFHHITTSLPNTQAYFALIFTLVVFFGDFSGLMHRKIVATLTILQYGAK